MPRNKKSSLDKRRDNRTEEKFKEDIKLATLRERRLLNFWLMEMQDLGKEIQVIDTGIDNSGEFVEFSDNYPDFKLIIDGVEGLYEVKQNPYSHRNSFKVYDLKTYIKLNAKILLFYGITKDCCLTTASKWAIIEPEAMKRMLLDLPHTRHDAKWGNKPIVVVWERLFENYFKSYSFSKEYK